MSPDDERVSASAGSLYASSNPMEAALYSMAAALHPKPASGVHDSNGRRIERAREERETPVRRLLSPDLELACTHTGTLQSIEAAWMLRVSASGTHGSRSPVVTASSAIRFASRMVASALCPTGLFAGR